MSKYPIELDDDDTTTNVGEPFDITPEAMAFATRPYHLVVWRDEDGYWCGAVPELPGHVAGGTTLEQMVERAEDAKLTWIAAALAEGRAVPPPLARFVVSDEGAFVVEMPALLAATFARTAGRALPTFPSVDAQFSRIEPDAWVNRRNAATA